MEWRKLVLMSILIYYSHLGNVWRLSVDVLVSVDDDDNTTTFEWREVGWIDEWLTDEISKLCTAMMLVGGVWWLRGNETYTIGWCRWLVYGILCGSFYLECFNFVVALEGVKWGLRGEWDCNYITSWRLFDPFEGSRGCQLFLGMEPWLIGHILMG